MGEDKHPEERLPMSPSAKNAIAYAENLHIVLDDMEEEPLVWMEEQNIRGKLDMMIKHIREASDYQRKRDELNMQECLAVAQADRAEIDDIFVGMQQKFYPQEWGPER